MYNSYDINTNNGQDPSAISFSSLDHNKRLQVDTRPRIQHLTESARIGTVQGGIRYYTGTNIPIPNAVRDATEPVPLDRDYGNTQVDIYDKVNAQDDPMGFQTKTKSIIDNPDSFRNTIGLAHRGIPKPIPKYFKVPDMNYRSEYVVLYSGDRDDPANTPQTDWVYRLQTSFKNVKEIKLVYCTYPNTNNVLQEQYLVLKIGNLQTGHDLYSNNHATDGSIALIVHDEIVGGFVKADTYHIHPRGLTFRDSNLLASLDKIHLQLLTVDGVPFDFGADTDPATKAIQVAVGLKVTYMEAPSHILGAEPVV